MKVRTHDNVTYTECLVEFAQNLVPHKLVVLHVWKYKSIKAPSHLTLILNCHIHQTDRKLLIML